MNLMDTDVLIEAARGSGAGAQWLASFGPDEVAAAGIAAIEFIAGSRDSPMLERAHWFLNSIRVVWMTEEDNLLAYNLARSYSLRSGLSMSDFLIAAQAINLDATLFTFNLKHFEAVAGLRAVRPYER